MRSAISRRDVILGGGALAFTGLVAACSNGNRGGENAGDTPVDPPKRGAPGVGGGTVTLRDVHIFDGERIVDADTLIIEGGLITAVERRLSPPDGSQVFEGRGGFLLPGLIDAHIHVNSLDQLGDSLGFGVSTVLDMFSLLGMGEQGKAFRSKRKSLTATDQADFWSAGYLCTVPGGHGTQFGVNIPVPAQGDDVEAGAWQVSDCEPLERASQVGAAGSH